MNWTDRQYAGLIVLALLLGFWVLAMGLVIALILFV